MSHIKITPELLADIEAKAKVAESIMSSPWRAVGDYDDLICHKTAYLPPHDRVAKACNTIAGHYIAAANPAVVLAMIAQITFLQTLLFSDTLPHDDPIFRAEELDKEVKELRAEVERLRAAQCWAIVNKETKATFLGPFLTEAHANDKLGSLPFEYARNYEVQVWKGGAE